MREGIKCEVKSLFLKGRVARFPLQVNGMRSMGYEPPGERLGVLIARFQDWLKIQVYAWYDSDNRNWSSTSLLGG